MNDRPSWKHAAPIPEALRPLSSLAEVARPDLTGGPDSLLPLFLGSLFQLARPIADASHETGDKKGVRDPDPFFELIDALTPSGVRQLDETLRIILDDFCQLSERSYDELYLWSIVHLSRSDPRHVETYWPLVFALDLRYRSANWRRPAGQWVLDRPYRFAELLFYAYVRYITVGPPQAFDEESTAAAARRSVPSLGACLVRIAPALPDDQLDLVAQTLRELAAQHQWPVFGDACGLLVRTRRIR